VTVLVVILGIFIIINIIMTYKYEREKEERRRARINYYVNLGKKSPMFKQFERNLADQEMEKWFK
jgi:hypothetical protein